MTYSIQIPDGLGEGQQFQAEVGGQMMLLTVPPGYSGGMPLKVDAPAAAVNVQNQMKHTSSAGTGTEEWGSVFGCFDDMGGCLYVSCCLPCAKCEMGDMIGADVTVGQSKETAPSFLGFGSQIQNYCSYIPYCCGPCIAPVACLDKCWCNYDVNILKAAAVKLDKNAVSPGPCDNVCLQVMCCGSCTYCLIYSELKAAKAGGTPEATEMARS